ncbi:MAG TPA: 3'(2'),5'-bisphosphate nucleotidase CysQ [Terriglobales bacterium]|nr:3'(2'),5'-bisphosphate nucleotidase CysQ [Terriglobales bacterium]
MDQLAELLSVTCKLSVKAGQEIMPFYDSETSITLKPDSSPLTAADTASHEFLISALAALTPEIPIVSEESADRPDGGGVLLWLVDPLDGTKEFIKGTDEFTVNVALIRDGRPILGVVHAPALNLTYYGAENLGSWRQNGTGLAIRISCRPVDHSQVSVVASKDHAGPLVKAMLSRLPNPKLQSMGSSLKFCLVAEGKADIYLRDLPTMEWDTAAAQCIVETAGGGVYGLDGVPLRYGKPDLRNAAIMTVGDVGFDWRPLVDLTATA